MGGSILRMSGALIILAFWVYVGTQYVLDEMNYFIGGDLFLFSHIFGFLLIFFGEVDELMRKS